MQRGDKAIMSDVAVPLSRESVRAIAAGQNVDVRRASIREMSRVVNALERATGLRFVRMEFGIPGLPASHVALDAEAQALARPGVANTYAPFDGIPELKAEASRFVKLFMNLDVPPECIVPTVGAMEGCFAGLALAARLRPERRKVIFLMPGFPVNRMQARFLGLEVESIDLYDHRGKELVRAVEERAGRGDACAVLWSSPNNPSWVVLKEEELRGLGRVCDEAGMLALEDLAYFGMDLRQDYLRPGEPPWQPTVMRYTKRGLCIISSSKMFSYAGQRIALCLISPELAGSKEPALVASLGTDRVGHAFTHGVLYCICACVPQGPQWALRALLEAACAGDRSLWEPAREYSRRAKIMKSIFLGAGFRLVYDNDLGEPLADGFYFTVSYPGIEDGGTLIEALLPYGVSAITLEATGSCRKEGLRACVSLVSDDQFGSLEQRLRKFHEDHQVRSAR